MRMILFLSVYSLQNRSRNTEFCTREQTERFLNENDRVNVQTAPLLIFNLAKSKLPTLPMMQLVRIVPLVDSTAHIDCDRSFGLPLMLYCR
jgi:hypothetical protein